MAAGDGGGQSRRSGPHDEHVTRWHDRRSYRTRSGTPVRAGPRRTIIDRLGPRRCLHDRRGAPRAGRRPRRAAALARELWPCLVTGSCSRPSRLRWRGRRRAQCPGASDSSAAGSRAGDAAAASGRTATGVPRRSRGAADRCHRARSRRPPGRRSDVGGVPGGGRRPAAQGADGRVRQAARPDAGRPKRRHARQPGDAVAPETGISTNAGSGEPPGRAIVLLSTRATSASDQPGR